MVRAVKLILLALIFAGCAKPDTLAPVSQVIDDSDVQIYETWANSVFKIVIMRDDQATGHGTGFLAKAPSGKLYVATAGHVVLSATRNEFLSAPFQVSDGDRWIAFFKDGRNYELEFVKGSTDIDCGFLAFKEAVLDYPKPFEFAKQNPKVGASIWMIGYPMWLSSNFGKGIVTSYTDGFMVTNAPIRGGNSGSPVFDKDGKVVGIAVAIPLDRSEKVDYQALCTPVGDIIGQIKDL